MKPDLQRPNLSSPFRCALLSAGLLGAVLPPVLSGAPATELVTGVANEPRHEDAYFSVLGDYRNYYTEYEPLCFQSITPGSPGHYGLHLVFTSNQPGFRQVEYAEGNGEFQVLHGGALFVGLDEKGAVVQEKIYRVRAVFDSPQPESVYTIRVNCMTRTAFEKSGGYRNRDIEIGSSHLVTEIFDRQRNQWIFIDGHQQTMGAYLGTVGPLTAHEFMLFINQPYRRGSLNVVYYDVAKDEERTMPVDQSPKQYLSYRGWTKGFHTTYRDDPQTDFDLKEKR